LNGCRSLTVSIVFCPARATVILLAALMLHPGISLSAEGRRPAYGRAHDSAVSQDKGRDGRETADPARRGNDAAEAKRLGERDKLNERRADTPATAVEIVGRDIDLTKGNKGEFHDLDALKSNIEADKRLRQDTEGRRDERANVAKEASDRADISTRRNSEVHDAKRLSAEIKSDNARVIAENRRALPEDAQKALVEIESGTKRDNVRQPKFFENDGRGNTERLPNRDENGKEIKYTEYTVNARESGQSLDGKRLIIGSDGRVYYTGDHFSTIMSRVK
jgi:guanyl-specific ribonuclease Sa